MSPSHPKTASHHPERLLLYLLSTPNGGKGSIMLEAMGLTRNGKSGESVQNAFKSLI